MPSRIDEARHTKARDYTVVEHWGENQNVQPLEDSNRNTSAHSHYQLSHPGSPRVSQRKRSQDVTLIGPQDSALVVFSDLPGRPDTSSSTNPVDSFVSPKLKNLIWNNEFVDLVSLVQEEPAVTQFRFDPDGVAPSAPMVAPTDCPITSILGLVY